MKQNGPWYNGIIRVLGTRNPSSTLGGPIMRDATLCFLVKENNDNVTEIREVSEEINVEIKDFHKMAELSFHSYLGKKMLSLKKMSKL